MYGCESRNCRRLIKRENDGSVFRVGLVCAAPVNDNVDMVLSYRYRIKDATSSRYLERQARSVNHVWNYCGEIQEDARGRWYLNLQVAVLEDKAHGTGEVGIDLGLKSLAALSTGEKIEAPRVYRRYERELAIAQRAGRQLRVRAIHAKIANCRRHFLHQLSTRLVRENRRICVGNVNSCGLARTSLAKSVLDAGWSQLRSQLRYKAIRHGAEYIEVDERMTTQVCSACGVCGGPKGREDLVVREWICGSCGAWHDRDINSAIHILVSGWNVGLQRTEIPSLQGREDVKVSRRWPRRAARA